MDTLFLLHKHLQIKINVLLIVEVNIMLVCQAPKLQHVCPVRSIVLFAQVQQSVHNVLLITTCCKKQRAQAAPTNVLIASTIQPKLMV